MGESVMTVFPLFLWLLLAVGGASLQVSDWDVGISISALGNPKAASLGQVRWGHAFSD